MRPTIPRTRTDRHFAGVPLTISVYFAAERHAAAFHLETAPQRTSNPLQGVSADQATAPF
ncbi:exported hypothetical protein [Paraburkholderia piptadeniae]|uniref:Uncharacterized protein n=1 Tax=Paraburkholderia piptadeniae TaxID=1701573 RepID=A0A1N7STA6_9BURK|nr:exported hypothetical protein [Paraburkholderia piptadeniae]